jgi:hypothetical protein
MAALAALAAKMGEPGATRDAPPSAAEPADNTGQD